MAVEQVFWEDLKGALADSVYHIDLIDLIIDNVVVLRSIQSSPGDRLWIAFKVRATNDTAINHYFDTEQAWTKARFRSSLLARMNERYGGSVAQISSMLLKPPRLAIMYAQFEEEAQTTEELTFWEKLLSTE